MKANYWLLLFLILSTLLSAYSDNDLDGVDDTIDNCPYTPFDTLVDKQGCPLNDHILGKLILQTGTEISFNQIDTPVTNLTIYANYLLNHWNFSLANSNYHVTNLSNSISQNTLYLTTGYTYTKRKTRTHFSMGTKFDLNNDEIQKRDNDFYASVNFEYFIHSKQTIFLYYSYTLSGDSKRISYQNFHSLSFGYGYSITDKYYTTLSYNYAGSYTLDEGDYHALSWFNSYNFTKSVYATLNYTHTFDTLSYSHTITFNLGVCFD